MVKNQDMSKLMSEFNWIIRNLDSVESRNQIPTVENLFFLWYSKYTSKNYKTKEYKKLTNQLGSFFFKRLNKKEENLWKI